MERNGYPRWWKYTHDSIAQGIADIQTFVSSGDRSTTGGLMDSYWNNKPLIDFYSQEIDRQLKLMSEPRFFVRNAAFGPKDKMETKNKKYWIVVNDAHATICGVEGSGGTNRRFETESAAVARAEQLAQNSPGQEFPVAVVISRSKVEKPTVTTRLV